MRTIVRLTLLAGLVLGLPTAGVLGEEEPADDLNEEWMATDFELATALKKVEDPTGLAAEAFLAKLDTEDVRVDRKTGFGGRQIHLSVHGGYASAWIHAAFHEDRIVGLRIHFQPSREARKAAAARYQKALGRGFTQKPDGFHRTWYDSDRYHRMRYAAHEALGAPAESDVPEALHEHYALLTSPLHTYDFGSVCYEGGEPPDGRVAIDALVAAKRWDLVGNVLRGLNPEGRVHAADALLVRAAKGGKALPDRDKAAIEKVRKLDIPISACSGCEVYETTAAKLLSRDDR